MINLDELVPEFSYLFNLGFTQTESIYNEKLFGDVYIKMKGVPFSLVITRDRGQILVEVGEDSAGWYSLSHVLQFVDKTITSDQMGGHPPNPKKLADLLHTHWDLIASLFRDQTQLTLLSGFIDEKQASFLRKMRGIK